MAAPAHKEQPFFITAVRRTEATRYKLCCSLKMAAFGRHFFAAKPGPCCLQ